MPRVRKRKSENDELLSRDLARKYAKELESLSPFERKLFIQSMQEIAINGESQTLEAIWKTDYVRIPVGIDVLLSDDYYLGSQTSSLYPKWRKFLSKAFDPSKTVQELIFGGAIGIGKCVAKGTMVPSSSGVLPIEHLQSATGAFVTSHRGRENRVTEWHDIGVYPTKRITTKFGVEIEGRAEHRIIVLDADGRFDWKPLSDCRAGDMAVVEVGADQWNQVDPTPESDLEAEAMGIWTGDGHFDGEGEQYRPGVGCKDLVEDWKSAGCVSGSENKVVPTRILRGSRSAVCAFLRGLFDTAGTVTSQRRVEFTTVSRTLAYQVQNLLINLGIMASRDFKPNAHLGGWTVAIVGSTSERLFEANIGFRMKRKANECEASTRRTNDADRIYGIAPLLDELWDLRRVRKARDKTIFAARKYKSIVRSTLRTIRGQKAFEYRSGAEDVLGLFSAENRMKVILDRNLWILPIKKVEDSSAHCYDLSVATDHSYLAGGFLSHNTTCAALGMTYLAYYLSCLRDPHKFYNLMPGSKIVLGIYSVTKTQAYDSSFSKIRTWIEESPYFTEHFPIDPLIKSMIVFKRGDVQVISGSRELHVIGRDVFGFLLDEVNFLKTNGKKSQEASLAYKLYAAAKTRLKSRFMSSGGGTPGMVFLVSSKKSRTDFLEEHIKEVRPEIKAGTVMLAEYSQWEVRDKGLYILPKFHVEVGDTIFPSRILKEGVSPRAGAQVIEVPGEFRGEFDTDIDQALRDLAGIATYGVCPLIHDKNILLRSVTDKIEHPFTRECVTLDERTSIALDEYFMPERLFRVRRSSYSPLRDVGSPRFVHIDIGLTGDCLGMAMAHACALRKVRRQRVDGTYFIDLCPMVEIDFMLRVIPPRGSEIDLSKVRSFLISIRDMGMPIYRVTCDGYQSRDFIQIMRKVDFESNIYSVDRTDAAYLHLRQAHIEDRIRMYKYLPYLTEMGDLERDLDAGKIDHPDISPSTSLKGSKDVSDGVAGAITNVLLDPRSATGVGMDGTTTSADSHDIQEVRAGSGRVNWETIDKQIRR